MVSSTSNSKPANSVCSSVMCTQRSSVKRMGTPFTDVVTCILISPLTAILTRSTISVNLPASHIVMVVGDSLPDQTVYGILRDTARTRTG